MKGRGQLDILADMLRAAGAGKNRTYIMYNSLLSHGPFVYYFTMAQKAGLLERMDEKKYRATQRGIEFLELYRQLRVIME